VERRVTLHNDTLLASLTNEKLDTRSDQFKFNLSCEQRERSEEWQQNEMQLIQQASQLKIIHDEKLHA